MIFEVLIFFAQRQFVTFSAPFPDILFPEASELVLRPSNVSVQDLSFFVEIKVTSLPASFPAASMLTFRALQETDDSGENV